MRLLRDLAIAAGLGILAAILFRLGSTNFEGPVPRLPHATPRVARVGQAVSLSIPTGDSSVDGHYQASGHRVVLQERDAAGKWVKAGEQPGDVKVQSSPWGQKIATRRSPHSVEPSAERPLRLRLLLRFPDEPAYRGKRFRLWVEAALTYPALVTKATAGRAGKFENRERRFQTGIPVHFLTAAQETATARAGVLRHVFGWPGLLCAAAALVWLIRSILKASDRQKRALAAARRAEQEEEEEDETPWP